MTTQRIRNLISGMAVAAALFAPTAAGAQDYVNPEQPEVGGETVNRPVTAPASDSRGSLPITGGDVVGLTAIGIGAVGVGTVLVRRSRRAHA